MYQNEESFAKGIALLETATLKSLQLQIKSGCDVVQIFDSWAGILKEADFKKWCLEPLKRIVAQLSVPVIYFCRGSSYLAPLIESSQVTCISVDWLKPIHEVRKEIKIPLQGNLDPETLYSSPADLKKEVATLLHSMKNDQGYIFNLGYGILPDVPYRNVVELVNQVIHS